MEQPVFRVERTSEPDLEVVSLIGELDLACVVQLEEEFRRLAASGRTRVVVDGSGLTFVDASGLGGLLKAQQAILESGSSFHVVGSAVLLRFLELVELSEAFPLFPTVEAAKAAIRGG